MDSEFLFIDISTPQTKDSELKQKVQQVCLNFSILDASLQVPYQIQLSIQNPDEKEPIPIGYSAPHFANPQKEVVFNLSFIMDYHFEKIQLVKIDIAKANSFLSITTELPKIMTSQESLEIPLVENAERIKIISNQVNNSNMQCEIDVKIPNANGQNIFYVISKARYSKDKNLNDMTALYKSEMTNNGIFKPICLSSSYLDYGDHSRKISFDVFVNGILYGTYPVTVSELLEQLSGKPFKINECEMIVTIKETPRVKKTFIELLRDHLEINLEIGIDFTKSNGNPTEPNSLHYISNKPNLYQQAITECGRILAMYDSDKIYPVFGFGAILPEQKEICHCFPITLAADNNPNIKGIHNIVKCVKDIVPKLTFSEPTLFAPTLRVIFDTIRSVGNKGLSYHVVLLLTDGVIDDMDDTIDEIVNAATLPVSIVIVGVGDADFTNMDILDCDNGFLTSKKTGKTSNRDIVQFVPFKKVNNDAKLLAEMVLEELPGQVEGYFNK
jgi:hypothetical protein